MTAQELGTVGGECPGPPVDVGEGHAGTEVGAEGIARQERAGLGVDLGDDMHRGIVAGRPQDPLGIERRRQLSRSFAHVLDPQPDQLDRVVAWHESVSSCAQSVRSSVQTRCTPGRDVPASAPAEGTGSGVGHQISPVSSSRR